MLCEFLYSSIILNSKETNEKCSSISKKYQSKLKEELAGLRLTAGFEQTLFM